MNLIPLISVFSAIYRRMLSDTAMIWSIKISHYCLRRSGRGYRTCLIRSQRVERVLERGNLEWAARRNLDVGSGAGCGSGDRHDAVVISR